MLSRLQNGGVLCPMINEKGPFVLVAIVEGQNVQEIVTF